ncbi:hypothetical protein [Streptomyces nitrosporeus]|uniref:hypothetical protein n=1 Tax=Streptomyces nitrosporeus TaxID=28894 RepID=UPI00142EA4AC|nr:hypothetical protein [Streptomyces nitrosporeus]GGZ17634.1 hypothetical protein GCM10010327_55790 [Streptomyces nitrosporeus]
MSDHKREDTEVHQEHAFTERLTAGLTVAVASGLSLFLLAGPAMVFSTTGWQLATDSGATAFSRLLVPVVCLALVVLPFVPAGAVLRAGLRKGRRRLTAAVPAALALLGGSVVTFGILCLIVMYAD